MELNRSGELGGAACCCSGVAGWMVVRRVGAALGATSGNPKLCPRVLRDAPSLPESRLMGRTLWSAPASPGVFLSKRRYSSVLLETLGICVFVPEVAGCHV